ncbi:MAG: hypothetical protein ACO20H_07135 [Bacteriovoracaceae bacterium]
MLSKKLFNKPFIAIGILFAYIFIHQLYTKGYFSKRAQLLKATSCVALNVKLTRNLPKGWLSKCDNNNLTVSAKSKLFNQNLKDPKKYKEFVFGELANNLVLVARQSPSDNLERTFLIKFVLDAPQGVISAITEGKDLVKLQTLTDKDLILKHFERTIQVIEKKAEKESEQKTK